MKVISIVALLLASTNARASGFLNTRASSNWRHQPSLSDTLKGDVRDGKAAATRFMDSFLNLGTRGSPVQAGAQAPRASELRKP